MHLVSLRNNRVWSTQKGLWQEAGSVCGSLSQRGDCSSWVIYDGMPLCFFLVDEGVAIARVLHDNLSIITTVAANVTCLSPATVAGGKTFCLGIADDGSCTLISFDSDDLVARSVTGLHWPATHVAPVLESVGTLFFLCPSAVYLHDKSADLLSHGVLSHGGQLIVAPRGVAAASPAHRIFCQTPRFSISTNGLLAIVDGDTFDLRTLLEPIEFPIDNAADGKSEILVGNSLDPLMPALIGGRAVCEAADGFARQSDIVSIRQDERGLWLRLDRPLAVPTAAVLKVYGGFSADPQPYRYQSGPRAGDWAPRGVVVRAAWIVVDGITCIAVARPGEVVIVQIDGRRVIAARRLGFCAPAVIQLVYDGTAVHVIDVQDRWAHNQRLFPVAGAGVGVCEV